MSYITYAEYQAARPGSDISESDFNMFLDISEPIIDRLTMQKIPLLGGLDVFTTDTQERVKKSVMYQIDTIEAQGGVGVITGNSDASYGSVSIGKFSQQTGGKTGKGGNIQLVDGIPISPMVNILLQPTGLLNRAMNRTYELEGFR